MYGGWKPSIAASQNDYSDEASIAEVQSPHPDSSIGARNLEFRSEAEEEWSIAPFLGLNKERDEERRNYVIRSGGAVEYKENPIPAAEMRMTPDNVVLGHRQQERP